MSDPIRKLADRIENKFANDAEHKSESMELEAEPEVVLAPEPYDFEFITFAMGLVPICNGEAAINLANIASVAKAEDGDGWILTLINDEEYALTDDDMVNLEQLLKDRKSRRKDVVKEEIAAQIQATAELQGGVQPGKIVSVGKRGFH